MHIGVIPDGNRRFMIKKGIGSLQESYDLGINKFHEFLDWCIDFGVGEVTLYALSIENLMNRSKVEIRTLVTLFSSHVFKSLDDERLHKNEVSVKFCGDENYMHLFGSAVENMRKLEEKTAGYDKFQLNIALSYGGRQEIINAFSKLSEKNLAFTEENIKDHLWIKSYPDLIIRTAESRLSNFLTWQSAYSEICFIDKLWQELTLEDFEAVIQNFNKKERRFGR